MKNLKSFLILTLASSAFFLASCGSGSQEEKKATDSTAANQNTTETTPAVAQASINLSIAGMTCENCANALKTGLSSMVGVTACNVNLENNSATVEFDNTKTTEDAIIAHVATVHEGKFIAAKTTEPTADASAEIKKCEPNCDKPCCKDKKTETKTCTKESKECCKKDAKACDHKEGEKK